MPSLYQNGQVMKQVVLNNLVIATPVRDSMMPNPARPSYGRWADGLLRFRKIL